MINKYLYKYIFYPVYAVFFKFELKDKLLSEVEGYFKHNENFRSVYDCSNRIGISQVKCQVMRDYLYKKRKLGLYVFEEGVSPQKYMNKWILKKYSHLNFKSNILEVGPGDNPLFLNKEYINWKGVDLNFNGKSIKFKHLNWAENKYELKNIFQGGYENLSTVLVNNIGKFDLVCGSHSFEHTWKPIQSLKEINKMLRPGGNVVLFVPDGFSDDISSKDPTHTLYVVPGMMEEFFEYAGGFKNLKIEIFRPNADLVISAEKI